MKLNLINKFDDQDYTDIIEKVLKKAFNIQGVKNNFSINVILVDNLTIKEYNSKYRKKDVETDVLTFADGTMSNLGDVIISLDKVKEQSIEYEHSFNRELAFLTLHGFLHTLGFDHLTKETEEEMNQIQNNILNKAKIYR